MSFKRPLVVSYEERGHAVSVRVAGPDLVIEVDHEEPNSTFYLNVAAARAGASRVIDDKEKEKKRA